MKVDRKTGEIGGEPSESESESMEDEDRVVVDFKPPVPRARRSPLAPGTRRATVSSSTSDDSKVLLAHARTIEVEGTSDRLGLAEVRESLGHSEIARRGLTDDLIRLQERHEAEVDRVRDEYDRAANASEGRHAQEAARNRREVERLQREAEGLRRELKDEKKSKKKAKKKVVEAEYKIETLREKGLEKRAFYGMLASGVPPMANAIAQNAPTFLGFIASLFGGVAARTDGNDVESVRDRAAAIRFAGRLFDPQNELAVVVLQDLERLAFDTVTKDGETVFVSEWESVQRHVWAALRREAEAAAVADVREVVDQDPGDA